MINLSWSQNFLSMKLVKELQQRFIKDRHLNRSDRNVKLSGYPGAKLERAARNGAIGMRGRVAKTD